MFCHALAALISDQTPEESRQQAGDRRRNAAEAKSLEAIALIIDGARMPVCFVTEGRPMLNEWLLARSLSSFSASPCWGKEVGVDDGLLSMLHEARTDISMFLGLIFLLIAGGGAFSIDALKPRRR